MNNILDSFKKILAVAADSDIPVLLTGETGAGKEVAAKELHNNSSQRQSKPFIAVNCGALTASLAESLLCGHVRGAFTGANAEQKGLIMAANKGTLFLDEIGELSPETQKILLRILQEKTIIQVGAQREIHTDFRLICATNQNLTKLIKQGKFREDLYFRISALPIEIPPLRNRLGELKSIAETIWTQKEQLNEQEIELLKQYKWPGNIRQLKNVLERYALFKKHGVKLATIISKEQNAEPAPKLKPTKTAIMNALEQFSGNKSRAAQNLGISRGSLCYQIKKAHSPQQSFRLPCRAKDS